MKDRPIHQFTCKSCSSHTLYVTHVWSILAGGNEESWQEWGSLNDNHHWRYEFTEKIDENEEDVVQRGDFGEFLEDDSSSEPEEYEVFETEAYSENDEIFVNCANCDREIEFGWTQPNRGGLIMPVEFLDFVPQEAWPDPKYVDVWQKRGWLRAMDLHPS